MIHSETSLMTPEEIWSRIRSLYMEQGWKLPKIVLLYKTYKEYESDFICNKRNDEYKFVPIKIEPIISDINLITIESRLFI